MPPDSVTDLRDAVINEASFDVTPDQALRWLNRSFRKMVGDARAFRQWLPFGQTVSGQSFYKTPRTLEVYLVTTGGAPHTGEWDDVFPYCRGRRGDSIALLNGLLGWTWRGSVGLFEPNVGLEAVRGVNLLPVPTDADVPVMGFCAVPAPWLTADSNGDAVLERVLDWEELGEELINGALAIGYSREGNIPLRDAALNVHAEGTRKLAATTRKRFRGPGPAMIRLAS